MSIQAVIFDWGGTLTPWHDIELRDIWRTVCTGHVAPERLEEITDALLAAESELWRRSREEHRSATLDELFAIADLTPTEALLATKFTAWEPHTITDPEAPAMLRALRDRGLRVGVLSNTMWTREWHERIFARDGVLDLFHGAIYSSEIPWTKPHPKAFHAAMDAIGITDPAQCVYVGDRPFEDVHGSQSAGMKAVLIPNNTVPKWDATPDATITSLAALPALIDSWRTAGSPGKA